VSLKTAKQVEELKFGQVVTFRPLEAKKSRLKLNRSRIWFSSDAVNEGEYGHLVPIQSLKGRRLSFILMPMESLLK
jgi:hypothetical protein